MSRFTIILALSTLFSFATNAQAKLFNSGDKVVVQISSTYGKVYVHEMSPQQTVYSLSKTFDQRMKDIESVNPGVNFNSMKVGQKIRVPFLAASMVKNPADVIKGGDYATVYYKIRPKDNLYRIAKVYFDTSVENLQAINRSQSSDLKADDLLKVGWLPLGATPKAKPIQYDYSTTVNNPMTKQAANAKPNVIASASKKQESQSAATAVKQANANTEQAKPSSKERQPARAKAKKKGFLARVFGSKSKKKTREKKEIRDVVQLSEQLEEKSTVAEAASPSTPIIPQATNNETPLAKPEGAVFQTIVEAPVLETTLDAEEAPVYVYKQEKGIAIWNQTSTNSKNMFVLHPTAFVGSYIELTNPMLNKTVKAKVIGNIPPRTYTDDVSVVVSPRVAKMLGVVDRRFAVRMKFREE